MPSYFMGSAVAGVSYLGDTAIAIYQNGNKLWERDGAASIYFNGSSYIDTGYKPTGNSRVEVSFTAKRMPTSNQYIFGSQYSSGSLTKYACYIEADTGYLVEDYSDTGAIYLTDYSVIGQDITLSFSGAETVINGTAAEHTVHALSVNTNGHTNHNIYIGALDQNNAVLSGTGLRAAVRYFKIYEGSALNYSLEVRGARFYDTMDGVYYDLQSM